MLSEGLKHIDDSSNEQYPKHDSSIREPIPHTCSSNLSFIDPLSSFPPFSPNSLPYKTHLPSSRLLIPPEHSHLPPPPLYFPRAPNPTSQHSNTPNPSYKTFHAISPLQVPSTYKLYSRRRSDILPVGPQKIRSRNKGVAVPGSYVREPRLPAYVTLIDVAVTTGRYPADLFSQGQKRKEKKEKKAKKQKV